MELERMHHQSQGGTRPPPSRRAPPHANMEHLNLSLPLHVQVPPLPSPNTTAAAAALFRVNQLPSAMSPSDPHAAFGFKSPSAVAFKKRHRLLNEGLGIFAPSGDPATQSIPTPTTAAAAAAAMALSAASPASAASVEQYEQNKRAMLLEAAAAAAAAPPPATSPSSTTTADERPSSSSAPDAQSGNEMRRRKVGIPKFLRYLFQMLEYEDHSVIAWSHDGAAFQIRDPDELAERILPKYFKHNKVSSFQRQLNYFGFKKWTKTQTNICTFSHPHFIRDEQDKMRLIKRKERSARKDKAAAATNDDDDDDESDDHDKPPPAKRAKASTPKSLPKRAKKEPKPSRAKKTTTMTTMTTTTMTTDDDRPPARGHARKLPTISPNASSSTASTPPSAAGRADAAPVLPVHAEMLQQPPPFLRRFPYDNSAMQELSEAFAPTPASWAAQGEYAPFKFSDANAPSLASFDAAYANNANNPNNANNANNPNNANNANAKDYLDVLLESANMDEQLAAQSASGASDSSMGWEPAYQAPPTSQGYAREPFMGHGMQLPSIEDLQGAGRY